MRTGWKRQIFFVVFAIAAVCTANGQNTADKLQPLVALSARRLQIAEVVARSKWDTGTAVEDVAREEQVLAQAVKDGEAEKLDRTSVSSFFKAQIEANKTVQYTLLADWYRHGAPTHTPINSLTAVRPMLDEIEKELIA